MKNKAKYPIRGKIMIICGCVAIFAGPTAGVLLELPDPICVFGTIILCVVLWMWGGALDASDREKAENEWHSMYSDSQWRADHPVEASIVRAKWFGPAVSIDKVETGYYDPGNAYRSSSWSPWANSAGGWSVRYTISNIGVRQIKYVVVTFAAYNAVGDKCYCRTHNRTDASTRYTGPLSRGCSVEKLIFENAWYDISLHSVRIEHIHVDFMDGTSQDISKDGTVTNHGF